MKNNSRTLFIKTGLVGALGFSGIVQFLIGNASAEEKPEMIISYLIHALRSTNKSVCLSVAHSFLALKDNKSNYDLHLRNAGLNNIEIQLIAEAIKIVHDEVGPSLKSFSMSYNTNLRDEGVFDLIKALPPTVTEIGLVQCGIGDKGGNALMAWALQAPELHWLCIEQNNLSEKIKAKFIKLGKQQKGLLVVV